MEKYALSNSGKFSFHFCLMVDEIRLGANELAARMSRNLSQMSDCKRGIQATTNPNGMLPAP